jgi:hypothetical protein
VNLSGFPGLRGLLGWPDGGGGVGMRRQLIAMKMGMSIVPGCDRRYCLRFVSRVRIRMAHGVVFFFLLVPVLVLAGRCPGMLTGVFLWFVSR